MKNLQLLILFFLCSCATFAQQINCYPTQLVGGNEESKVADHDSMPAILAILLLH
jgi:hypothetical protein